MSEYFLKYWVLGQQELRPLHLYRRIKPDLNLGAVIRFEELMLMNSCQYAPGLGLREAWNINYKYYKKVKSTILEYSGINIEKRYSFNLMKEYRDDILEDCGYAPSAACPIYMITLEDEKFYEEIMYIGKSTNSLARFSTGHHALIKVLDSECRKYKAHIYFGSITFFHKKYGELPLEFIGNKCLASKLLSDVERQLIYKYKPDWNVYMKKHNPKNLYTLSIWWPDDFKKKKFVRAIVKGGVRN